MGRSDNPVKSPERAMNVLSSIIKNFKPADLLSSLIGGTVGRVAGIVTNVVTGIVQGKSFGDIMKGVLKF